MKKLGIVLAACGFVAACTSYEPDQDIAAEKRREAQVAYHQDVGCPMVDDHEAYRNCVINTYYKNSPKTFVPAKLPDGRSVAIIRNDQTSSYDEATDTYKTERVVVIETVETISGKPAEAKMPVVETPVIETPAPTPAPVVAEQPKPAPKAESVIEIEVESTPKAEPVPAETEVREQTWWETYQKEKPAEVAAPQCPCPDPNEPCPQCIDK